MPRPRITMELLHKLRTTKDCRFIKGIKEDYWINYRKNGEQGWADDNSVCPCSIVIQAAKECFREALQQG